jgi:predicted nuclease of predicted toxin-antitoxin system
MKALVDENIPLMTVRALREMGHDVLDVRGTAREGMSDDEMWDLAQQEQRLVVTTDKGFARRRRRPHHGILVIRLRRPNRTRIHERIMQAIGALPDTDWPGRTVTVRDDVRSIWPTQ